jgi:hypothetical protein
VQSCARLCCPETPRHRQNSISRRLLAVSTLGRADRELNDGEHSGVFGRGPEHRETPHPSQNFGLQRALALHGRLLPSLSSLLLVLDPLSVALSVLSVRYGLPCFKNAPRRRPQNRSGVPRARQEHLCASRALDA